MKKQFVLICMFFLVLALHAKAIQEDYKNADEKARISYAFGMLYGSNFPIPLDMDYTAFAEGFRAMVENTESELSQQEAIEIVETTMNQAMEKIAEENRLHEEEFLVNNSRRPEVLVTPSGLQYEVLVGTDGDKPEANSVVKVNYTGAFLDGSIFDKSSDEGAFIPLQMVIPGWTEGLMLMGVGSSYRLYIPSTLAYGKNGVQNVIPPYSTLIFTVELLEIMNEDYP